MRVVTSMSVLIAALFWGPGTAVGQDPVIAYVIPAGTPGNQAFGGTLGLDFDVQFDLLVTRLGVFDDSSDGLNLPISARLYDRELFEVLASVEFSPEDPGELVGGSRFKDLPEPVELTAGFLGSIVAEGYGAGERNGNQGGAELGYELDSGGCAISFVGTGRFGNAAGAFPDTIDAGPRNQYAAGTFVFEPLEEGPGPAGGIAYGVPEGTLGNDTFGGALGMDFDVNVDLFVTSLGVFDDGSDGLVSTITARLYDRDSRAELGSLEFTPEAPGSLVGGHRLDELDPPLALPAGTRCTIVAEGYSELDPYGNASVFALDGVTTDNGRCAIEFVGRGRVGPNAGEFPGTVATGAPGIPVRFAAGTFAFEPSQTEFERPGSPTGVTATGEDGRVRLSWTAPAEGPAPAGYNVYQTRPGARTRWNPVPVTGTSIVVADLLGGVEHCFVVLSVLASGIESGDSEEACASPTVEGLPGRTVIAYEVLEGTAGNQGGFGGSLGLDFDVNTPIVITRLGVFDDGSDGLNRTITARLFDRDTQGELVSVVFTVEDSGELIGGSRFVDLDAPLSLPEGFHGSVVAEGYGADDPVTADVDEQEMNGNTTISPVDGLSTNGLDCALSFIGGRYGAAGFFPVTPMGGAGALPLVAGTFEYGTLGDIDPEPPTGGTAYVIAEGVVGNQAFVGALGMDFEVNSDIFVTELGVFDDTSDGLFLSINARLYDRDGFAVLGSLDFTPDDPGELIGGSRFKELDEPIGLPAGFHGTIVASGYGAGEQNGNQGGGPMFGLQTDDGGCLLTFVGGGRFGDPGSPGIFPDVPDGGPADRYAAGTFNFEPADEPINLPPNPPRGLVLEVGDGEVLLSWVGATGATPAVSYKVFRSVGGADFALLAEVEATELRDTDVSDGVEVCYRLRSLSGDGQESADSSIVCGTPGVLVEGRVIAYPVPAGLIGNTPGTGEVFGLDFDVVLDVLVTRVGVFDSGTDGLSAPHTFRIYDREARGGEQEELLAVEFSPQEPGVLIGGSRFLEVDPPLELPAGSQVTITAEGFSDADPVLAGVSLPTDGGPCALEFIGGRRDLAGFFPLGVVPGAHSLAGPTLEFEPLEVAPIGDGGVAYINPLGTFGNQAFSGSLGMDFDVLEPVRLTGLGVFDDGSDGLGAPLNARLYDRDSREVLARIDFSADDPGELVDGSRFKELDPPLSLAPGFHGTIVGQGYGEVERNGNQGAFDLGLELDNGGCQLRFVGGGRFGNPALGEVFPDSLDGGPANRYAAGTFVFESDDVIVDEERFVRGDANSSGIIDLTDGVVTLNFLFTGGPSPACRDAADTDDNGVLNISDAVVVFAYLFTGGSSPVAPSPSATAYEAGDCGTDPATADDPLECATRASTCRP